MKNKLITLAGLLLLGVFGVSTSHPAAAQTITPFVTTVTVDAVTNFNYTSVPIPKGTRLQIDYISLDGAAGSTGGPIVPIIILATGLSGQGSNLFYFAPLQNLQQSTQFYSGQQVTIYADTLAVGPAFAGYAPSFDTFNVVISGHLITPSSSSSVPPA